VAKFRISLCYSRWYFVLVIGL